MYKLQEAFGRIKDVVVFNKNYSSYRDDLELVQKAVDKETPMKLLKSQIDGYRECGNCNSIVVSTNYTLPNYCSNCSQRVDWGENE